MQLSESYRPSRWEDVCGQSKVIDKIKSLAERGLSGRAYWISGLSGTGKDTIARLMAAEIADEMNVYTIDAGAMTGASLREIEDSLRHTGMGAKNGRAVIISEAHGLRKDVIRSLLVALERIPKHAMYVFTTTKTGQEQLFEDYDDAGPLMSRCIVLKLAQRDLAQAFAKRAQEIAQENQLDGRPIRDYIRLVQIHRQNFRAVLNAIEAGEMALCGESTNGQAED